MENMKNSNTLDAQTQKDVNAIKAALVGIEKSALAGCSLWKKLMMELIGKFDDAGMAEETRFWTSRYYNTAK